mmetsp:Transcript_25663/g.22686  ORF Transcript_25663/g.22686 Transcript_25663/m.22686 type:complete len:124 (-) Transcript_25663:224-595(-)
MADECVFAHDDNEDRRTTKFTGWVGQNLAISFSTSSTYLRGMVGLQDGWYDEVELFEGDPAPVDSYASVDGTGHYTAMVWAKSYSLGCGYVKYHRPADDFEYQELLACNYGPGGNVLGQKMYT